MSIRFHVARRDGLTFAQDGEDALGLLISLLLARVLVRRLESGKKRDGARGGELHITPIRRHRSQGHGRRRYARISHLRGECALPDEVIERELIRT